MEPLSEIADSRTATNALLTELRKGHMRPAAVARFLGQATHRSVHQAVRRPQALAQLTALHGLLLALATGRQPGRWVMISWALSAAHLGLLEQRERLTAADALTLIRANLPALPGGASPWSGTLAIALDLADGRLARHYGTASPFGDYADTFADAAYWSWLTLRHEPSRTLRTAAIAAWALPVVTVTTVALRRGTMPQRPRPTLLRPAAALQAVVALRHLTRRSPAPGCSGSGAPTYESGAPSSARRLHGPSVGLG